MDKYIITNGEYFIGNHNGIWGPVKSRSLACWWDDAKKPANVLRQLPPILRGRGYEVKEVGEEETPPAPTGQHFSVKPIAECGEEDIEKMFSSLSSAANTLSSLKAIREQAWSGMVEMEKIQADVLHLAEFKMERGLSTKLGSALQKCRRKRRYYKLLIELCDELSAQTSVPPDFMKKWREKQDGKMYTPRSRELWEKMTQTSPKPTRTI